jgi:hypothetical protein
LASGLALTSGAFVALVSGGVIGVGADGGMLEMLMHGILLFARIVGLPLQKLYESDFEIRTAEGSPHRMVNGKASGLVRIVAFETSRRSPYWSRPR